MFIECNKRALGWSILFESKIEFEKKMRLQVKTFYFSQIIQS